MVFITFNVAVVFMDSSGNAHIKKGDRPGAQKGKLYDFFLFGKYERASFVFSLT